FRQLGRTAEALEAYRRALRLRPGDVNAPLNLGPTLAEQGARDPPPVYYRPGPAPGPNKPQLPNKPGDAPKRNRRPAEARPALRRATELLPEFAMAHANRGRALAALGRTDEAIAALRQAARLEPGVALRHVELADALLAAGRPDAALLTLDEALRL